MCLLRCRMRVGLTFVECLLLRGVLIIVILEDVIHRHSEFKWALVVRWVGFDTKLNHENSSTCFYMV